MPGRDRTPQQPRIGEPQERTPFPEMQRPMFLSGKVMMDDGTPPPDSVVIERVCNGRPRPEAYTDSKGRFSFEVGRNMSMMADASVSATDDFGGPGRSSMPGMPGGGRSASPMGGGVSERDLMGCELRASLAGFRSDVVNLSGRRVMDNPDVGIIVLHRLAHVEGTTISMNSLKAPKDAKKALDKGRDSLKKKKLADARKHFEKAVQVYPEYATAWYELGRIHENESRLPEAESAYGKAAAADPKFISPYLQLAGLSARAGKWQDVADTTARIVQLNSQDFPAAHFYNAVANYNLQKLDAAEKSAREAVKLDTEHRIPKSKHLLGVILAQKQDYQGATESLRAYLEHAPQATDADAVKKQLTELEQFTGARSGGGAAPQQ